MAPLAYGTTYVELDELEPEFVFVFAVEVWFC